MNDEIPPMIQFQDAMVTAGLAGATAIIPDGHIHRFCVEGDKRGSQNGWYVLYGDGVFAGAFGSWKTGQSETWCVNGTSALNHDERRAWQEKLHSAKVARDVELAKQRTEAAQSAREIWEKASEVETHLYLTKKQIRAHGIKIEKNQLVVPLYDRKGQLHSLQFIDEAGEKRFLTGGAIRGHYHLLGTESGRIWIVEGYATGATVYEAMGGLVVIAFNAGNLEAVARSIRHQYPNVNITIVADNDQWKERNTGVTSAQKAAQAIDGLIVIPQFAKTDSHQTDFNDLCQFEGMDEVIRQFEEADTPQKPTLCEAVLEYTELLSIDLPERKRHLPFLPEAGSAMVFGSRGIGKTFFELSLASALTTGRSFLRWDVLIPVGVLYIDGEMALDELRSRMTALLPEPPKAPLRFLTGEWTYHALQRDLVLTSAAVRGEISAILEDHTDIRVVILDNISCLFSGIDENSKKDWEPINAWLIRLRHRGLTTILVHHGGKGGQQRGTSGREDSLDTVIQLSRPTGYDAQEGCHFELTFSKCRSAKGEDVASLDVKLEEREGRLDWVWKTLEASKEDQARSLYAEGVTSPTAIAKEIEISLGYASKLVKKFKTG